MGAVAISNTVILRHVTSYLPSFPYHENPILHTYAGMLSFHLAVQDLGENGIQTKLLQININTP